jgi:hypothetical protein
MCTWNAFSSTLARIINSSIMHAFGMNQPTFFLYCFKSLDLCDHRNHYLFLSSFFIVKKPLECFQNDITKQ